MTEDDHRETLSWTAPIEDGVYIIPPVRVEQATHPVLYEHLCRIGITRIAGHVVEALEREMAANRCDHDHVLSTILSEVQAIRSRLDDQSTPDQDLPPDVEDALAGLGKGGT